jgi:aspartyl-tRNA(Asn)/glutamyl-tRNA(Gln) amidotransferase subunit C
MSSVDEATLNNIAELARLAVEEPNLVSLTRDLNAIIGFVEQMNAVDTEGVDPMAHPLDMAQRLRVDEITECSQRELYQGVAPSHEGGLYLVPRVLD